jgi:hypothetical protein
MINVSSLAVRRNCMNAAITPYEQAVSRYHGHESASGSTATTGMKLAAAANST